MTDFFIQAAGEAFDAFERKTRDDGTTFYVIREAARDGWVSDAVYKAHDGMLPDDWTYKICADLCAAAHDEGVTDDDALHEWADGGVEVYNSRLLAWLADRGTDDVDEAREEFGPRESIIADIQMGQYLARRSIGAVMLEAIQARADELEAEADDDDDAPDFGALTL